MTTSSPLRTIPAHWTRHALPALAALALLVLLPSIAHAEACPNEAQRGGLSSGLPDCRAFEAVSPLFNEGAYTVLGGQADMVSSDGEALTFETPSTAAAVTSSGGAISNYIARRTPQGWETSPLYSSAALFHPQGIVDFSPDLSEALYILAPIVNGKVGAYDYYKGPPGGGMVSIGPPGAPSGPTAAGYAGGSMDLTHVLLDDNLYTGLGGLDSTALLVPSDQTEVGGPGHGGTSLVEDVGAGSAVPVYRLVGLDNDGRQLSTCETQLGSGILDNLALQGGVPFHTLYHAVSADGARVFFTARAPSFSQLLAGECGGTLFTPFVAGQPFPHNADQALVRIDGAQTINLALSPTGCTTVACTTATAAPVVFEGASKDGTRAFVTTRRPLLDEDVDGGMDLYECDLSGPPAASVSPVNPCPRLIPLSVSGDASAPADVQGVVRVSSDGSHVYFVAHGALTSSPNSQGAVPVPGDDNLYVADTSQAHPNHQLAFIGKLSGTDITPYPSGAGISQGLWGFDGLSPGTGRPAQTSADGRYLLFTTAARLTADDTDSARDVYRYDADTGALTRISAGSAGYDADGNNNADDASIPAPVFDFQSNADLDGISALNGRALSDDGSTVVFQTSEPLVASDVNDSTDIYEWHNGSISLITDGHTRSEPPGSSGPAASSTSIFGVTPDARDVFIHTPDVLVPGASGSGTVYDARIDGGFAPSAIAGCSGDACQGPLTPTPSAFSPTSSTYRGSGNLSAPPVPVKKSPTAAQRRANKLKAALKRCRKDRSKPKRTSCKKSAHKRFGPLKAPKK